MRRIMAMAALALLCLCSAAQVKKVRHTFVPVYDESKVPEYTLPDPLRLNGGAAVTSVKLWEKKRRAELLDLFSREVYGWVPSAKGLKSEYEVLERSEDALGGKAVRKQVRLRWRLGNKSHEALMLMYIPKGLEEQPPVFLHFNFNGNRGAATDSLVLSSPMSPNVELGHDSNRWPMENIVSRGYAVATMFYGDIFPDEPAGRFGESILALYGYDTDGSRPFDGPGATSAWAWGYSRCLDYLLTDGEVDGTKTILGGHSRLARTALWAAANDRRFAAVAVSSPGHAGAALSRRKIGESTAMLNMRFPHWFAPNYGKYNSREEKLPVDQHELVALIAPRPIYIDSAEDDGWADPKGEYLGLYHAGAVYALYGVDGVPKQQPALSSPIMGRMGYHIRPGKHDVLSYDWQQWMNWADRYVREPRWPDGSKMSNWFSDPVAPVSKAESKRFVITDFGAVPDSVNLQTAAIQRAIDVAAKKGGTVVVPEGIFLTSSLFFKPGTHLLLEKGAVLKGSDRIEDYPDTLVHIEGVIQPYVAALVNAYGVDGFSIRGEGAIDGNGLVYWKAFWERRKQNENCTNLEVRRPRMIYVAGSSDVTIDGVTLRNSGFWTTHLYKCSRVRIHGVTIYAPNKPVPAPSSDAIDLDACTDVHVWNCNISVNDDIVAVKGGKGPWADTDPANGGNERILVEGCYFGHGPGVLVFGSECIHARNVILRDSEVHGAHRVLWLKMRPDTPQKYEYIEVSGIRGESRYLLYVRPWTQFFDLKGREDIPMSYGENITLRDCRVECSKKQVEVVQKPDQYVLTNINIEQ